MDRRWDRGIHVRWTGSETARTENESAETIKAERHRGQGTRRQRTPRKHGETEGYVCDGQGARQRGRKTGVRKLTRREDTEDTLQRVHTTQPTQNGSDRDVRTGNDDVSVKQDGRGMCCLPRHMPYRCAQGCYAPDRPTPAARGCTLGKGERAQRAVEGVRAGEDCQSTRSTSRQCGACTSSGYVSGVRRETRLCGIHERSVCLRGEGPWHPGRPQASVAGRRVNRGILHGALGVVWCRGGYGGLGKGLLRRL